MNPQDDKLFARNKRYALAVSGGVDSMVMLDMLAHSEKIRDFFVVTVNHCIRPDAESDCRFVADYCDKLGVECRIFRVDVPAYAAERKLSTETAARILRYRVFDGLDCDYVCLAHNADDNAETVLMHIIRGSGAKGASGIRQKSGRYIRPLLQLTRAEIERYAREHDVPFVNDSTNDDTRYARNFIRHKVMPLLEELNPAVKQNILRFAQNIASDDMRLNAQADKSIRRVRFDDDGAHIPAKLLADGDQRLLDRVFARLGVHCDIEQKHYFSIFGLVNNCGGKKINLPFGYVAYNDYDCITIRPEKQLATYRFEIPFALGRTETPVGVVEVGQNGCGLRIDVSKLPDGAVFRTRREGDVFTKFGGGTKPLNRYLIDKKVPERDRDGLLLIAVGNEVFAIMGLEISEKLRVDEGATPTYIELKTH